MRFAELHDHHIVVAVSSASPLPGWWYQVPVRVAFLKDLCIVQYITGIAGVTEAK